jgi:hypothetical protein
MRAVAGFNVSGVRRMGAILPCRRVLAIVTFVVAVVASTVLAAELSGALAGTPRDGELVADGAWSWFQDPRAVHYAGAHDRTYIGYVTSTGDVDVVSQDAGTAALQHTTLHAGLQADDHAAPGLVVLPDGRIAVFYSKHVGDQMLYRISANAEDVTSFGAEQSVATNIGPNQWYTYGNPIYLSAEHRLYVFFRGGDNRPVMTWTSDYVHWSPAVDVVIPDGEPAFTRPYVKYATNGIDTIAITFTDGHPSEVARNSVYEMIYKGGVLRAPDGAPLSVLDPSVESNPPLTVPHSGAIHTDWLRTANDGGLIYNDPGGAPAWIESMALDSNGAPVVVYSTYQNTSDAPYDYAHWNGTGWTASQITDAGGTIDPVQALYSGGADLDHNDPGTVYLSRETSPGSGQWEIEDWRTADGGASFVRNSIVTPNPTMKHVRPVAPWGSPGEIRVLWMAGTYTDYHLGKYHTQLRELTTGLAPTTARIGASALAINNGSAVQISGRIVQGYQGVPVPNALVELLGHTSGQPDQLLQRATADSSGLASFTRRPSEAERYTIRVSATTAYGGSTSPSIVVNVRQPAAVRISTSASTIRSGQSVVVGMRAVDARTGAFLPHATIELWQAVPGHPWQLAGRYTAGSTGLVQTTRRPSTTVTYQARLVASTTHEAAASPTMTVRVT